MAATTYGTAQTGVELARPMLYLEGGLPAVRVGQGGEMNGSRMSLKSACAVSVLLGVAACVHATFVPTGTAYPAKAANCEMRVFSSALPERPYEELGLVEGDGDWWKSDLEDVLPKVKEEACLAGGDAIILFSSNTFAEGDDGIRVQRLTATVIRWKTRR